MWLQSLMSPGNMLPTTTSTKCTSAHPAAQSTVSVGRFLRLACSRRPENVTQTGPNSGDSEVTTAVILLVIQTWALMPLGIRRRGRVRTELAALAALLYLDKKTGVA